MAQIDSSLVIDLNDLDLKLITDLDNILDLFNTMVGQLGDVAQSFFARQEFNKRAELHQPRYFTGEDLTGLDLTDNILDHLSGPLHAICIDRRDEDVAILMDIDLDASLINDFLDDLAARTDDLTDLIGLDLAGLNTRCIR